MADDRAALTQRIKAACDIVEVVGGYVALRQAGQTFKGLCPFHDDKRPSFDVDPRRQRYKCWSCGKSGDVFTFIQETERVSFLEARELLARKAGIPLEKGSSTQPSQSRALMLDLMRWVSEQYHRCLLDSPAAEAARLYLGERNLTGETIRKFGLGFAPAPGNWLLEKAAPAGQSLELLEKLGLIGARQEGNGYYDRFRDRVMFPIRDLRGQTVGFGGRILPTSPSLKRDPPPPKYYNSAETVLFSKSDQLYAIDQARPAAIDAGHLVVVEGYMDVLMAHQTGITNVVATMGTALNLRHVQKLRGLVPRVILVFDADAGGTAGVDRALEVFVRQEMDLRIATLPEGLDPCDLVVQKGPEAFQSALTNSIDVLEFKLNRVCETEDIQGIEGRRRAIDSVLGVLALASETRSVKLELMVNRIAHRFGTKEETLWTRLAELKKKRDERRELPGERREEQVVQPSPPASRWEEDLLRALLASPELVPVAKAELAPSQIENDDLRLLLEGLYRLQAEGTPADLDQLRARIDNLALVDRALDLQDRGTMISDRAALLRDVLARFRERDAATKKQDLQNQLHAARDHDTAVELLRQLQQRG